MAVRKQRGSLLDGAQLPEPKNDKINFSFEFYDTSRECYCLSGWEKEQVKKTLECLKDINGKTYHELLASKRVYHFGEVYWNQTTERNGYSDPRVNKLEPYHFALIGVNGQLARVFGAFSKGTFYIVWFDLNHQIWPSPLRHT